MTDSENLSSDLREFPINKVKRLDNKNCVYCAIRLNRSTQTKEHVIGRRFVPKGSLENQWNLIVNACSFCNSKKAGLEDDISAITLQPNLFSMDQREAIAILEGERKSLNSVSQRTGKPVHQSNENMTIRIHRGEVTFTFNMTSPPQIDEERVFELARLHITAFFYFLTYSEANKRGSYWPDECRFLMSANSGDWGNPVMQRFADIVVDWEPRILLVTADAYFKVVIRKNPSEPHWSWALEWNQSKRIIGFFGDRQITNEIVSKLPKLKLQSIQETKDTKLRVRIENPINSGADRLFNYGDAHRNY